jgi:hypothetical protein
LVPAAVEHRFDIRTTGPEPLNNQPFFRYDRVDEAERVRNPTELQYLVECLQQIDELTMDEATVALAAFVRVCLGRAGKRISASLESIAIGLRSCIEASRLLLAETAEGGKRAQALVAAAFDVVYGQDRVRTRLVNDPSRHFPGDVQALDAVGLPLISAEVRSKPVAELEIERFAQTLQNAQISRGLIAALATDQAPLANSPIVDRIASDLGVLVTVVDSVDELLTAAFGWSTGGLSDVLALFPQRVSERLRGIDADDDTVRRWTALLRHAQFEAERLKAT